MKRPRRPRLARRARPTAAGVALLAVLLPGVRARADRAGADDDPWLGRDKALHFSFSAVLAGGGYGAASLITDERGWRLAAGAGLALSAGLAKEAIDLSGRGDASVRDLTWDVIGTASGLLVAWTIDRLIARWSRQAPAAS